MSEEVNEGTVEVAERLTFPPFPVPPPGLTIVPFHRFVAQGLIITPEGASFHADGTPTASLNVSHSVDGATKKKGGKKKKNKKGAIVVLSGDRKLSWWEVWEQEDAKVNRPMADARPEPGSSASDILSTAGYEFEKSRPWPSSDKVGLRNMWDQMKIYMGMLSQPKASKKDATVMDDSDDEEEFAAAVAADVPAAPQADPAPDEPESAIVDEKMEALPPPSALNRDELRIQAFMDDPESHAKIMLSSWFRDRGMIWSKEKCRDGPKLLSFFFNFVIRAKLFPADAPWKKALEIARLAEIQLPLTNAICETLPGDFSQACIAEFGPAQDYTQYDINWGGKDDEEVAAPDVPVGVTEIVAPADAPSGWGESTDTLAPDVPGWGASLATHDDSGWGAVDGAADPWAQPTDGWGGKSDTGASWGTLTVPALGELPGTAALARTHMRGIVEQSTRRVTGVVLPNADRAPCTAPADEMSAADVEGELDRCYAKITLAPWGWWDDRRGSELHYPDILPASKGAVVIDGRVAGGTEGSGVTDIEFTPFHPCEDSITVLATPKNLENVAIGLGPNAVFQQIVRKDGTPSGYWYMESLVSVIPSYYWLKSSESETE